MILKFQKNVNNCEKLSFFPFRLIDIKAHSKNTHRHIEMFVYLMKHCFA